MKKIIFILVICLSSGLNAAGIYNAGKEKSIVCAACHGQEGLSINPLWPNLAGQHAGYLVKQLNDFKNNITRSAPTMLPMVANLNEQDMEDLALFYESLPTHSGVTPKKYLNRGEQLYRGGDFSKHITACIACHGPKGTGNSEAGFPNLSGQNAQYTILQLQNFKDGLRKNDINSIMRDISSRMSKEDMEAVANYIAGLY